MEIPKETLDSTRISCGSQSAGLVFQLQLCVSVLPPGTVLDSLLSLLGENIVLFCSLVPLLGWWTGYGGTQRVPTTIPFPSKDQECCLYVTWQDTHITDRESICVLLPISQTQSNAQPDSPVPATSWFFLPQDSRRNDLYELISALSWRNRGGKHWNERCVALILQPSICKLKPTQLKNWLT